MILLSFIDKLAAAEVSAQVLVSVFLAILFLQSGIDKVVDWKGNLGWITGHFSKSPLAKMVPVMLFTITIFELAAGITSAIGAVMIVIADTTWMALFGAQLSALSIVMLFFGQRVAKDYAGAATLVAYFIVCILGIILLA